MKLIKPENLKAFNGELVECQYVSCPATRTQFPYNLQHGPPYEPVQSRWYPR